MLPLSEFVYQRRVQFPETDASGLVHFTNFFRYVEEAEHAMWRAAGLSISEPGSGIGWPRIAAAFDFHRPLHFEDEFEVHLRVAAKTSKTLRYAAVLRKDGQIVAEGSLTIICVRRVQNEPVRAVDMPADIASRFTVAGDSTPA
jgi:acyl-CoA thioester hydrolase